MLVGVWNPLICIFKRARRSNVRRKNERSFKDLPYILYNHNNIQNTLLRTHIYLERCNMSDACIRHKYSASEIQNNILYILYRMKLLRTICILVHIFSTAPCVWNIFLRNISTCSANVRDKYFFNSVALLVFFANRKKCIIGKRKHAPKRCCTTHGRCPLMIRSKWVCKRLRYTQFIACNYDYDGKS